MKIRVWDSKRQLHLSISKFAGSQTLRSVLDARKFKDHYTQSSVLECEVDIVQRRDYFSNRIYIRPTQMYMAITAGMFECELVVNLVPMFVPRQKSTTKYCRVQVKNQCVINMKRSNNKRVVVHEVNPQIRTDQDRLYIIFNNDITYVVRDDIR